MSKNKRINFQEIAERVDTLIDMADDKKMVDEYPTEALLKMVEVDYEDITSTLSSLPDIDV